MIECPGNPFDTFEPNGCHRQPRRRPERTHPPRLVRWGEDYIQSRYGTPCQAWTFWQARKYYGPLLAVVPF